MNEFVIAVDVDVTICPSDKAWLSWLEGVCQTKLDLSNKTRLDYDLTTYFKEELAYQGLTGMEFWKQDNLYDNLPPIEGSVEALESLYEQEASILAVSAHYGRHAASKRDWVYKHYPFVKDVILLDKGVNKCYVKCDVIIEDHVENLEGFGDDVEKIVMWSPYLNPAYDGYPYKYWWTVAYDLTAFIDWRKCK